ncbi:hypothetical protein IO99_02830 [Clostridium sulfidigenes]|uniref:Uncharacterized protein n=1 Tax=Clostridium sulfidigenes TaxID=318464 RepID=A0A084JHC4_9CLOT|nr:hypothetical protein [Clostridium sulfidigenes]KEZ88358.1 hypothetical protein IO99_02830 [Clostridium sulfidigenes]
MYIIVGLNMLLVFITVIYMVKNILINYRLSESRFKNGCIAILICIMVWFAGNGTFIGIKIIEAEDTLEYMVNNEKEEYEEIDINSVKLTIEGNKEYVKKYFLISGVSFIFFVLLTKNISKEIRERPTTSKWDLSKYK